MIKCPAVWVPNGRPSGNDTLRCTRRAALIVSGTLPFSRFGLMAAKTVYFFSTALMCYFWFIYFEHLQGSAFVKQRRYVWLSSALVWAEGLLLIVNAFTGILFYVDAGNAYCRGPLFAV